MVKRILAVLVLFIFSSVSYAAEPGMDLAKAKILGVANVKEGMNCYGYSTLGPKGQTKFTCKVLGVLYDQLGPGHNWVAVQLGGEGFRDSGIIAGQSGSPVYVRVKGKEYFVGTLSYGEGFSKVAIGYLTPAEELLAVNLYEGKSVAAPAKPTCFAIADTLKGFLEKNDLGWLHAQMQNGTVNVGLTAVENVSTSKVAKKIAPPKAGDVLGVQLAYGDFTFGGFGTVSYVDQNKIFMFGHPMMMAGPVEYRLVRAKVLGVQASYMRSHLIAAPIQGAETLGVITQDRETAIFGDLGKEPKAFIPFRVKLTTSSGAVVEKKFYVSNDRFMGPVVGAIGVSSILESWSRDQGPKTIFFKGEMTTDSGNVILNDVFYGNAGSTDEAARSVYVRLKSILGNDYKKVAIKEVVLEANIFDEIRVLKVERVTVGDSGTIYPGSFVDLKIVLSQPEKEPKVVAIKMEIPKDLNFGVAKVVVGGAEAVDAIENRTTQVVNLSTLLENMNQKRNPNRLYVYVIYPPAKPANLSKGGEEVAKGVRKITKRLSSSAEEFEISPSLAGVMGSEKDGDFIIQGDDSVTFKIGDPALGKSKVDAHSGK